MKRGFASDNFSGIHPEILEAIANENKDHAMAYGHDESSEIAVNDFKKLFGENIEVFFAMNGTGANVIALSSLTQSYNSILCPSTAHIQVDECGAPDKFTGCKVIPIETQNGKICPDDIKEHLHGFGFEHHSQPKVISISNCTELGTVYTAKEIKAICDLAHQNDMYVHLDGARIANAVAYLNVDIKEITINAGVDVLSFGGTKNGLLQGEAVVFFNTDLAKNTKYIRKQSMQLFSKMRFISAQFSALLKNDLWLKTAQHSNKMAQLLYQEIKDIENIEITQEVQSNGIWARIPKDKIEKLQNDYFFWVWDEHKGEVRWLCSFDTTKEDISDFSNLLKKELQTEKV